MNMHGNDRDTRQAQKARKEAVIRLDILISNSSDKPIYEQIESQIKNHIITGRLAAGDPLPSMRTLSAELRISMITTRRAYEELERDGFITTVPGKGCFVSERNSDFIREEHLRVCEEHLRAAVDAARVAGIGLDELRGVLEDIYKEDAI